ncbi:MAG: hypothetical protein JST86_12895 [Bacteroidetes bacterium]|nr:hypothetical protein [Bacteroidota bacterium]
MKIRLYSRTADSGGGLLKDNLASLDDYIQQKLDQSAFQSSFNELSLTIFCPSKYVDSAFKRMEDIFNEHYATLPYCRVNRRFKSIAISLKAPEFSTYFQTDDQKQNSGKFSDQTEFKDLSEVDLAKTLIDKYSEAIQFIKTKIKKEDIFDFEIIESVLSGIKEKISSQFLNEITNITKTDNHNRAIAFSKSNRRERLHNNTEADTLIRDIRLYFAYKLPPSLLYLNRFANLVLRLLNNKEFKCPGYHHLYISIADTREEALKKAIIVEDWYTFGVAVLAEDTLVKASHDKQQKLILQAIEEGLLDIATLDKLNKSKIQEAIKEAAEIGVLTEIPFKVKENKRFAFAISTKTVLGLNEEEIFFTILDKESGLIVKWKFGQENIFLIGGWFGTLNVTNKKITIKPRAYMDMVLKDRPKIIEIDVLKELNDSTKLVLANNKSSNGT